MRRARCTRSCSNTEEDVLTSWQGLGQATLERLPCVVARADRVGILSVWRERPWGPFDDTHLTFLEGVSARAELHRCLCLFRATAAVADRRRLGCHYSWRQSASAGESLARSRAWSIRSGRRGWSGGALRREPA
jgi:hypothetical protein